MPQDKQPSKQKQKYKVGQILAIPLPNGQFSYGKVFNDLDVGVYDLLTKDIVPVEQVIGNRILFYDSVTDKAVKNGDFIVIGEQPFPDEEAAWAPPKVMGIDVDDHSDGVLNISHKGEFWPAEPEDAAGLDIGVVCQRSDLFVDLVVDRLVNRNNLKYKYTP